MECFQFLWYPFISMQIKCIQIKICFLNIFDKKFKDGLEIQLPSSNITNDCHLKFGVTQLLVKLSGPI